MSWMHHLDRYNRLQEIQTSLGNARLFKAMHYGSTDRGALLGKLPSLSPVHALLYPVEGSCGGCPSPASWICLRPCSIKGCHGDSSAAVP